MNAFKVKRGSVNMQVLPDDASAKDRIIAHLRIALEECDKLNASLAAIDINQAIEKMLKF